MSEELVKPEKVLPADYCGKEEMKLSRSLDDEDNPRLRLNIPAGMAIYEIFDDKNGPPLLVIVCRADFEIPALGILEKAKILLMNFQVKLDKKLDLTKGVKNLVTLLRGGIARA